MNFRPSIKADLKTVISVISWIPDAKSCLSWAGPRVRFLLELEQLYRDIESYKTPTYSLENAKKLLPLNQIRLFKIKREHSARIVVNPSSRGKGIGRLFRKELINEAGRPDCRTISLNVDKDNLIAINLYKKLGFVVPPKQPGDIRKNIVYMELE